MACAECREYASSIKDDGIYRVSVCYNAARLGHLGCLKYFYGLGKPWSDMKYVVDTAARHGHLDCMRFAHKHGIEWGPRTCSWAAQTGHLACLRYAHMHGARWDTRVTYMAVLMGQTACLRYVALHLPVWPGAPAEIAEWRDRVRATAATIMRIVRRNRAEHAATVIQRFWLKRHYAPGGEGLTLVMAHFNGLLQ